MAYDSDDSLGHSSSDESAIDFLGLKHTVYQENMAAVEKAIKDLEKGTHKELLEEISRLEQEREDRLHQAELYRDYRRDCVQRALQEEKEEIISQNEKDKEEVQANMLEDVQERKRRLEEERNSNDLVEDMPTGYRKSVRSKKHDGTQKPAAQEKPSKRKKLQPPSGPKLTLRLKDSDISEDLMLVSARQPRGEKSRGGGRRQAAGTPAGTVA